MTNYKFCDVSFSIDTAVRGIRDSSAAPADHAKALAVGVAAAAAATARRASTDPVFSVAVRYFIPCHYSSFFGRFSQYCGAEKRGIMIVTPPVVNLVKGGPTGFYTGK